MRRLVAIKMHRSRLARRFQDATQARVKRLETFKVNKTFIGLINVTKRPLG